MYKNLKKISTVGMSRDTWIDLRRKSIGGSDAAAVVGLNPYVSRYSLWADKRGLLPEKEDTEAMRLGRDLEDYVAKRFTEETGKRVRRENNIIINPKFPFAHANVDRMIIGEDAGLECKTTSSLNLSKFKNGEYPANYYVQCVHYMMVTGAKRWYLAVLILGVGFKWFTIERDEAEIQALAASEREFWQLVQSGSSPPVDGSDATTKAMSTIMSENADPDQECDLFAYEQDLERLEWIKLQIRLLDIEAADIENNIKQFMNTASVGRCSRYTVSFKTQHRTTFDTKSFKRDHAHLDFSRYEKDTISRPFKVSVVQ